MNRHRNIRLLILAGLILLGLSTLVAFAAGPWSIVSYSVSGNTVTTQVHNTAGRTVTGTISVEIVKGTQTFTGVSASVSIGPGATVPVQIIVGTITDDITPFDSIIFRIQTD